METKKKRNILLTFVVIIAILLILQLTGHLFDGVSDTFLADFLLKLRSVVLAVLGALILRRMWIYKRFDGKLLKKSWATGLPELLIGFFALSGFIIRKRTVSAEPIDIVFFVLEMICVGIHEETVFRGLLQNAFHEIFGEDTVKHVILATVCAGVTFGLLHLTNALEPDISLSDAAIQALSACGGGIFYGAVYFRTGKNLWYCALIHAIHDMAIFLAQGALSGASSSAVISQSSQSASVGMMIGQTVGYALIGLFLLRKRKAEPLLTKPETEKV